MISSHGLDILRHRDAKLVRAITPMKRPRARLSLRSLSPLQNRPGEAQN